MKIGAKNLSLKSDVPRKGNETAENYSGIVSTNNPNQLFEQLINSKSGTQNMNAKINVNDGITGGNLFKKNEPEKLTSKKSYSRDKTRRSHYITKK